MKSIVCAIIYSINKWENIKSKQKYLLLILKFAYFKKVNPYDCFWANGGDKRPLNYCQFNFSFSTKDVKNKLRRSDHFNKKRKN